MMTNVEVLSQQIVASEKVTEVASDSLVAVETEATLNLQKRGVTLRAQSSPSL